MCVVFHIPETIGRKLHERGGLPQNGNGNKYSNFPRSGRQEINLAEESFRRQLDLEKANKAAFRQRMLRLFASENHPASQTDPVVGRIEHPELSGGDSLNGLCGFDNP